MSYYPKKYYGKKILTQEESILRYQVMNSLLQYLPYLGHIPQLDDVSKYPNNLLQDLFFQLTYVTENHFLSNPELGQAYNEIYNLHQQVSRQQQEIYFYQLQQRQIQAEYAQQNYRPVDYNQGHNPHYGHGQKQYQPRHHHQGQYPRNNDRKYQNREGQRNNQQGDRYGGHGHHQRGDRTGGEHGGYRKNFHQKGHNQTHYQKNFIQHEQETTVVQSQIEVQKVEEVVIQPQVVVVVPKPEPKPVRFSISQIKEFINSFSKEDLQKHANPEVVEKTKEISSWKCEQVEVEMKEEPVKFQRKQSKRPEGGNYKQHAGIKTGVKKDEAKQAERMGYKPAEEKKLTIVVGAKQTLETRQMKEELKKKASDFVGQKLQEEKGLNKVQKDKKEIVFNLNLIVPENLKDIEKDLVQFLYHDEEVCKVLVEQTIKKAWDQPKYASTYARLCADFSKKPFSDFKFEKKHNPFKTVLVESVQHSFDQRIEKFPIFESSQDKQLFLKQFKKKILSNVKFIAELIICKVLKRRIIKYCVSQLFESFFKHYYAFIHDNQIEDSVYDYHYEAIIEFIENIGEKYDELDQKEKDKQQKPQYNYKQIQDHIQAILKITSPPNNHILDCINALTGEEYFQLLAFINETYMKKAFPRLGALLQNLVERKNNKWQKHLSVAQGPKKLKQIQEDIENQEHQGRDKHTKISKQKLDLEKLDKKVKQMYEGWEMGKNEQQREMKEILKKHNEHDFYFSLLKQVADEKKEKVAKRVELIPTVMDHQRFKVQEFRNAWVDAIKYLTIGGEDFPFCGAALAKVLEQAIKRGGKLEQYHKKYEDEQQELFSEQVVHKYYFYTKDESALKIIKPKARYSGLI